MGSTTGLSSKISLFVDSLLRDGKAGVSSGNMRIQDVGTSGSSLAKQPCGDRFKLAIPYAGRTISWEVLFNQYQPDDPPDFIFGPEDKDFQPDIDDLKSLVDWDSSKAESLVHVVHELLESYRNYQQDLLAEVSRLQFEYTSLLESNEGVDLSASDIEVHVTLKDKPYDRIGPVSFLIKLPVDFSLIPPHLTKNNPGVDSAVLVVTFPTVDGCKAVPQLFLSPRVEHALGGSGSLRIPAFANGGCLIDYIPQVVTLLKNKVEQVSSGFSKRKEYISCFLSLFGKSIVEHDVESFMKVTFLMTWHDFFFLVSVELTALFPNEQPAFVFQSVYHESSDGKPFSKTIKDYPYSPRWSAKEMADRARQYFLDNIGAFQKTSVKDGSL